MKLLEENFIGKQKLRNRIVMPPMCMYIAEDGLVNDFHIAHYTTRALGGVGMIIVESTAVTPNGRISKNDLGLWNNKHINGLKRLTDNIKKYGAVAAVQLNHAGRKSEIANSLPVAPSAIYFSDKYPIPVSLSVDEIHEIIQSFQDAAVRAVEAGFDLIEIHGAHGYLIHEFLSPFSNTRTDEYGGTHENRARLLKEVLLAVRSVLPKDFPVTVRLSAIDYLDDGLAIEDSVKTVQAVEALIDAVHVSTGGISGTFEKIQDYPAYQVQFAKAIKDAVALPVIAVGQIKNYDLAEAIIRLGNADLVAVGREIIRDPFWAYRLAKREGLDYPMPEGYLVAFNSK